FTTTWVAYDPGASCQATRSPAEKLSTPSPTAAILPVPSEPTICGYSIGYTPERRYVSMKFTPAASTSTSTSPGPATGVSTSLNSRTSGPPASIARTAWVMTPPAYNLMCWYSYTYERFQCCRLRCHRIRRGEVRRLLSTHPQLNVTTVCGHSTAGEKLGRHQPHLARFSDLVVQESTAEVLAGHDVVVLALPHGQSGAISAELEKTSPNTLIVDLAADHRLISAAAWEKFYGSDHQGTWTYGLPELLTADGTKQREALSD